VGAVSKPVLVAVSNTSAFFHNWRGIIVENGYSGYSGYSGFSGAPGPGGVISYWGSFWDTTNQPNSPGVSGYNTVALGQSDPNSNGVYIDSGTKVRFIFAGVYNIQFSIQFTKSNSSPGQVNFWLAINGLDIADTNSIETLAGQSEAILALNYVTKLNANDFVEFRWSSASPQISIATIAASSPVPQTPGVIVTATQVTYQGLSGYSGYSGTSGFSGTPSVSTLRSVIGANRVDSLPFYFNSFVVSADSSSAPNSDAAFIVTASSLNKISVYLRQSGVGGGNNTSIQIFRSADGSAFSGATALTSTTTQSVAQDTMSVYTFSGLTINQYDAIFIKCTPTSSGSNYSGIITIE
jgi:hypothetical protein